MSDFLEWATHGVKRGQLELNARPRATVLGLVAVVAVTAGIYLGVVGRTAAQGRRIEQLQAEVFRLQRENHQLSVDIARASGVRNLRERAEALGFVPAENVEFLVDSHLE